MSGIKKITIEIASPPDRENLVAEIWLGKEMVAEISREGGELEIELYSNETLRVDYEDFISVLMEVKGKLIST